MDCPPCQSLQVVKNGRELFSEGVQLQRYRCNDCGKRCNQRTGTPMARLRAPSAVVATALNRRTEGMGARAADRTFGKSYSTILRWEERLANQVDLGGVRISMPRLAQGCSASWMFSGSSTIGSDRTGDWGNGRLQR